jgi:hypothetical protein
VKSIAEPVLNLGFGGVLRHQNCSWHLTRGAAAHDKNNFKKEHLCTN